jgi:hypothetical protein
MTEDFDDSDGESGDKSDDESGDKSEDESGDKSGDDPGNVVHLLSETEHRIMFWGLEKVGFGCRRQARVGIKLNMHRFKAQFEIGPRTINAVFEDLRRKFPKTKMEDLLLTLNWFKLYESESVLSGRWGYCEKYIRGKVKETGKKIQSLKKAKIVFGGFEKDEVFIITVDGVNFRTQEFRLDPSSKWFDHKTKSTGLTYELALSIRRQALVWMNGPFPSGLKNDGTIYRGGRKAQKMDDWEKTALFFMMPPKTRAVADSGYANLPRITTTNGKHSRNLKKFLTRAKQRQESFHTRLKSFHILEDRFRHGASTAEKMELHQMCTEAICVIAQYDLENGNPLFEV